MQYVDNVLANPRMNRLAAIDVNFNITVDAINPLMLACTMGNMEIVKILLANPTIDVNRSDNTGINALYVSVYYGHLAIYQLLESQGAVFHQSTKGTTLLHIAAKKGFIELVEYLIGPKCRNKMHIDKRKKNGMTPAMIAAVHNQLFVLKCLVEGGANLKLLS